MSVLADRDIRTELESGRVRIDPYDPADLQPSSVDLHLDRSFRVFRNNRYAFIDPRTPQPDLTEMLTIVDLSDIASGVIKAVAFGLIVGLSGCLRGLQAERSAAGVGRAATSAVVTSILLIIIADAIFAVVFNALGI